MATVILKGSELFIKFNDGMTRGTGIQIDAANPEQIETQVVRAIGKLKPLASGLGKLSELDAIKPAKAAKVIRGQLQGVGQKKETEAPEDKPKKEKAPPETKTRERVPVRLPVEKKDVTPPSPQNPIQQKKETRATTTAPEPTAVLESKHKTPQPTVTAGWIERRLAEAKVSYTKGAESATALYANENLDEFLKPLIQRGVDRTTKQKETTVAVFNALYQIPKFRLYLSSQAAARAGAFPEFSVLQDFLSESRKNETLTEQAGAAVIQAADTFIRYYLLNFVGTKNGGNPKFSEEMSSLPKMAERMTKLASIHVGDDDSPMISLMKTQLGGAMDKDTVVAATLYLRRWYAGHPRSGDEIPQDQIEVWKAPKATVTGGTGTVAVPVAPAAIRNTTTIGIIGDSITLGTASGNRSYADLLKTTLPGNEIGKYGISGNKTSDMRKRFDAEILNYTPAYGTVVIQGGVNDIAAGVPLPTTTENMKYMINKATKKNMQVVVFTVGPWAGSTSSNKEAQDKTFAFNKWLLVQDGKGIVVVDLSNMGTGNPPRLKKEYDYKDGLHPNLAGQAEIARLAAEKLSGMPQKTRLTPLQEFAEANWKELPSTIYEAARDGKPEDVIAAMRNLPEGYTDLGTPLRELGRTDITDAFDKVFNDYLHQDADFLAFVASKKNFSGIGKPSVRLSSTSTNADRRYIAEAAQEFIRSIAQKADNANETDQAYTNFKEDIKLLSRTVLGLKTDEPIKDGMPDMKTIAAVAVYAWRMKNKDTPSSEWAQKIPGIAMPKTQQAQPVAPVPAEGEKPKTRRVLQL